MENEQKKIENLLHVFDLIKDHVITPKIGKRVAEVIAETGETAEQVIATIGLKPCIPDVREVLNCMIQFPDLYKDAKNGSDKAMHELVGRCMRASGGRLNPNMVRDYIANFESQVKKN